VRDAAGEASDRLELLALPQLFLELALLGDVLGHRDHVVGLAVGVADEGGREACHNGSPVLGCEDRLTSVGIPLAAHELRIQPCTVPGVERV
jgi:hypothetical protein